MGWAQWEPHRCSITSSNVNPFLHEGSERDACVAKELRCRYVITIQQWGNELALCELCLGSRRGQGLNSTVYLLRSACSVFNPDPGGSPLSLCEGCPVYRQHLSARETHARENRHNLDLTDAHERPRLTVPSGHRELLFLDLRSLGPLPFTEERGDEHAGDICAAHTPGA